MLLTRPNSQNKTVPVQASSAMLFGRRQFMPVLLGLAVIAIGFTCMALDPTPQGYGFLGLTLGPVLVLTGLMLPFFGIFRKSRPKTESHQVPVQEKEGGDFWKAFNRWNLVLGWAVALVALTIYVLTLEPAPASGTPASSLRRPTNYKCRIRRGRRCFY
jgi:hypothetical protein